MSKSVTGSTGERLSWATFSRFLPYLWPKDMPAIRRRVVWAMVLVVIAKAITLLIPFAYKAAIDRMAPGLEAEVAIAAALVIAYAGGRFAGVFFDNIRNTVFGSGRMPPSGSPRTCFATCTSCRCAFT
jgi:ATP-binding cassette, subfamily B, heavy metal transporter